ncbi:MAG: hypothetical protein UR98_C0004G0039 [Parcubacteria group bacterium GW2011_GWA1_36_12]|nr:MAG: hypothetical protein UR98_C0004G0039 [Parcubacteria group bacterium GW2011_GWA1_36_12]
MASTKKQPDEKAVLAKNKKAKKNVYDGRLSELIKSGELKARGVDGLFKLIHREFNSQVHGLTKKVFQLKVDELLWTKEVEGQLKNIVGHDIPLAKFEEHYSYIPRKIVEERASRLSGVSNSKNPVNFMKGLGRIGDLSEFDGNFKLPKTTLTSPYPVPVNRPNPTVMLINGANIGLKHQRLIKNNPVKRMLVDAKLRGDSVVIVVNPIDIEVKKAAGPASIFRAFFSGQNINIDILDPAYQAKAKKIRDNPKSSKFIYEITAEKLVDIIDGWSKISRDLDDTKLPEFDGPILIGFGHKEAELIAAAAYWELRYLTLVEWHKLGAEIRLVKSALTSAEKRGLSLAQKKFLEDKLEALISEQSRTIISNISVEDRQRFYRKVLNFVVKKFEDAVPNSKVVSQGTFYAKIGNEDIIEFNIPKHVRVSDRLLADNVQKHGPRILLGNIPKTVIICHPYALNMRFTVRESVVENGQRGSVQFYVAPIAVDDKFLAETLEDSGHPIAKAVFNGQFKPGALRLNFVNGMLNIDNISIESLFKSSKKPAKANGSNGTYPDNKFIWVMTATDPHFGSRAREEFWCESRQQYLGVSDAAIQMMREANLLEAKLPVHFYNVNDDWVQGNHFGTHKQPDQLMMSYTKIEKEMKDRVAAVRNASPDKVKEALTNLQIFVLDQFRSRGSDWYQEQVIQVIERHLEPNLDFWNAILSGNLRAGLTLKGVSEHKKKPFDARDVGFINCGSGNHTASTLEDNMTDGFIFADKIKTMLFGLPKWHDKKDFLDEAVAASLYGNKFFAWGTVKAPGGYEWGLEFRSDPPRMGSWADTLLGAVNNDATRGDYGGFMTGRVTLKTYGDKHFFAAVSTRYAYYHMCAAGTHTDPYGERGFPPNNTGVSFVGLPVNGPDSGPILLRTLRVEHIREYFKKNLKIDWDVFLPNPV